MGKTSSSPTYKRVRGGLGWLPDTRSVFMGITVAQNLKLGRGSVSDALDAFPELQPLLNMKAGVLSGGQQQILAVARVLAAKPRIILADELSVGLAPQIVDRLLGALRAAADAGAAVLIVEQFARIALEVSDRGYVLRRGEVALEDAASQLLDRDLSDLYL